MALTNAEKQKRWRDKRNVKAQALDGTPKEISKELLRHLGPDKAKKVVRALDKRLRNLKPDCPACKGTGFTPWHARSACGMLLSEGMAPCDCAKGKPAWEEMGDVKVT
jgi:hypothetical protein